MPISELWKTKLIESGCDENKILVHHCGVEYNRQSFNKLSHENKINILTIARLVEKKGVEYGIRAVAKIGNNIKSINYNIVGDGPLRKNCEHLIAESCRGGHAQFIMATHSPILLACEQAKIFSFDHVPVSEIEYEATEHYRIYKQFLMKYGKL